MRPPIEDAILQANPKFAALHKSLLGIIDTDVAADTETSTKLREHRIREAKRSILRTTLESLPLTNCQDDLIENIITNTPDVRTSELVSKHLYNQALPIARLLSPSTNASYLHRQIPDIPTSLSTLQCTIASQKRDLEKSRTALVVLTTTVLSSYCIAIEATIRILEGIHGQIARSAKTKAEVLSLNALESCINAKSKEIAARSVYTPEIRDALRIYGEHLRDGRARLKQREKEAVRELGRYGVRMDDDGVQMGIREKTIREISRVYGDMLAEVEDVREEVGRLRRS